jgi:hypothetical protein
LLIALAFGSPSDGLVMADPASRPVIIAFGVLLLPIGVGLVALSRRLTIRLVRILASVNILSGLVIGVWVIATWKDFSALGRLLAVLTVAGLIVLGTVELRKAYISNITSST